MSDYSDMSTEDLMKLKQQLGGQINLPFERPLEQQVSIKDDLGSKIGAGALAFGQGGMPVFDEAGAAGGSAMANMGMIKPVSEKGGWSDEYTSRLQNIRDTEHAFSRQYPNVDTGLRLAGGVAATIPFAGEIAARPLLAGATIGGAQGFTGSEGGFGDRLAGGAVGAGLGTATAGAIKYIAPELINALAPLNAAGEKVLLPSQGTIKNIKEKLGFAGITPQQYAAKLSASSGDQFAGEVGGDPLRIFSQSQAKMSGPNMQPAREAMRQRLINAPSRTRGILEDTFGSRYNIDDANGTIAMLKASEGDLYKAANGDIPRSAIQTILEAPAGQKAVGQAGINIQNRLGTPALQGDTIPINQAHEIAKALGDQVSRNPLTGAISEPATGAPIENLRSQVVQVLRKQSPEFDLAQTAASDARGFEDAMSRGRSLAKMVAGEKTDDVLDRISMNDMQQPYSVAGFHQGLLDATSQVPLGTGNPAGKIANQTLLNKTTELLGSQKANQLGEALMKEKDMIDFASRGLFNSNTAESLGANGKIPLSKEGLFSKTAEKIGEMLNKTNNQRAASLLYATSPAEKETLARALMQNTYFPQYGQNGLAATMLGMAPAIPSQIAGSLYNGRAQ